MVLLREDYDSQEDFENSNGFVQVLNQIGRAYRIANNFEKSLECYLTSLTACLRNQQSLHLYSILTELAEIYNQLGQTENELQFLQGALEITNLPMQKAPVLVRLARLFVSQGEVEKVIDYFENALRTYAQHYENRPCLEIGECLTGLAFAYHEKKDLQKAIDAMHQALIVAEAIDDKPMMAATLNNLGVFYKDQGQYEKAIEYYQKAMEAYKKVYGKVSLQVLRALVNIGKVYLLLGNLQMAVTYNQQVLSMQEEIQRTG